LGNILRYEHLKLFYQLEKELKIKIVTWIKRGKKIPIRRVQHEARQLAKSMKFPLKASRCWVKKFFKRNALSKRQVMNELQHHVEGDKYQSAIGGGDKKSNG